MGVDSQLWLVLLVALPLLAAIATFLAPRWAFYFSLGTSLSLLTMVIVLAINLPISGALRHTVGGWGAPLGIDLVLDGMAMLMLLLTAIIGTAITVYAYGYFKPRQTGDVHSQHQYEYFWPLWMFLWAALNALFLSGDIFNLYVTLELVGFSAVALTALTGKPAVLNAAMRYLLVSLSGSLLYLMGVAFLYAGYGTLDINQLHTQESQSPVLAAAAALITSGLVMKTALFPLHFWLPPAHANAAAPVSALLSALVVKGSFYILIRHWLLILFPLADSVAMHVFTLLGAGAILWGSLNAIRQVRLKLLIAYSTVAQLGYLFLLIPVAITNAGNNTALAGIFAFVIAHAVAKAAAFLSAGSVLYATDDDHINSLRGLIRQLPLTATTFTLSGVSLIALPPSAGFLAKWLLLDSAITQGNWGVTLVILTGGLLAAIYIMRVVGQLFIQEQSHEPDATGGRVLLRVPATMTISAFTLSVLAILLGFAGMYLLDVMAVGLVSPLGGG